MAEEIKQLLAPLSTLLKMVGRIEKNGTPSPAEGVSINPSSPLPVKNEVGESLRVIEQNPAWGRPTASEVLVTNENIGAVDNTWINIGAEVDVQYFNTITFWINFIVNASLTNTIQILVRHELGGSDIYTLEDLETYQKTLGDASRKTAYPFPVEGAISVQLQAKAGTIGVTAGTLSISITKA